MADINSRNSHTPRSHFPATERSQPVVSPTPRRTPARQAIPTAYYDGYVEGRRTEQAPQEIRELAVGIPQQTTSLLQGMAAALPPLAAVASKLPGRFTSIEGIAHATNIKSRLAAGKQK